jgi:hypothetical protein
MGRASRAKQERKEQEAEDPEWVDLVVVPGCAMASAESEDA